MNRVVDALYPSFRARGREPPPGELEEWIEEMAAIKARVVHMSRPVRALIAGPGTRWRPRAHRHPRTNQNLLGLCFHSCPSTQPQ